MFDKGDRVRCIEDRFHIDLAVHCNHPVLPVRGNNYVIRRCFQGGAPVAPLCFVYLEEIIGQPCTCFRDGDEFGFLASRFIRLGDAEIKRLVEIASDPPKLRETVDA